jgi:hypothetical protein
MISIRIVLAAVGLLVPLLPARAQHGEPLTIRNLNPLVAIFGLPSFEPADPGNRFAATFEVANHYRLSQRGNELLILDGETLRTTVAFSHGFDNGWSVGLELPYFHVSGGVLDDLIDGWHSTFHLPDGGRNNRPEDELWFRMADQNGTFFELDRPRSGLGDAQIKASRRFGRERAFTVQAAVKVPTGNEEMLAGSGSTDWSLTLLRSRSLLDRRRAAGYYWGVGLVWLGDARLIDFVRKRHIYTAVLGGSWQPWPKFGLKAQLDAHGAAYDSLLEEIGEDAIEASLGAWRDVGRHGRLEFAVVEDVEVSTAPDVVLQVAAKWHW